MKPDFGKELRALKLKHDKEYEELSIKQFITNTVYSRTKLVPDLIVVFSTPKTPPRIRFKASTRYNCQTITLKDVFKLYQKFPPVPMGRLGSSYKPIAQLEEAKPIHPVTFQIQNFSHFQSVRMHWFTSIRNKLYEICIDEVPCSIAASPIYETTQGKKRKVDCQLHNQSEYLDVITQWAGGERGHNDWTLASSHVDLPIEDLIESINWRESK